MLTFKETLKQGGIGTNADNFMGDEEDDGWVVVPCVGNNRDAQILTRSNWESALERLGGEGDEVKIKRCHHWTCGWIEHLLVKRGGKAEKEADKIDQEISHYPVLDDDRYLRLQDEARKEIWDGMDMRQKIGLCSRKKQSIFMARSKAPPYDEGDGTDLVEPE
jgi:hypothetical protein